MVVFCFFLDAKPQWKTKTIKNNSENGQKEAERGKRGLRRKEANLSWSSRRISLNQKNSHCLSAWLSFPPEEASKNNRSPSLILPPTTGSVFNFSFFSVCILSASVLLSTSGVKNFLILFNRRLKMFYSLFVRKSLRSAFCHYFICLNRILNICFSGILFYKILPLSLSLCVT